MPLVEIEGLSVSFATRRGEFAAVEDVSLTIDEGEALGIVGESGSGKSMAMLALIGLVPDTARVEAKRMRFAGQDLLGASQGARRAIAGREMAMIFQEPTTSLNPCFTVGFQIIEAVKRRTRSNGVTPRKRAIELLARVGIPEPEQRMAAYPHQLSGGMNQRVMIAMALACEPRLLIADEPTTALDVTIQAQILDLLRALHEEQNAALILVTHDMGVIAESVARVMVMYAGNAVEAGRVDDVLDRPRHPYTAALLDALPERAPVGRPLTTIPGIVPGIEDRPAGCLFHPRCAYAAPRCREERPRTGEVNGTTLRCHFPLEPGAAR
ncbi:MAG: ABC transporter ATP-binding protein [Alphaproteobacteria bacterium]